MFAIKNKMLLLFRYLSILQVCTTKELYNSLLSLVIVQYTFFSITPIDKRNYLWFLIIIYILKQQKDKDKLSIPNCRKLWALCTQNRRTNYNARGSALSELVPADVTQCVTTSANIWTLPTPRICTYST